MNRYDEDPIANSAGHSDAPAGSATTLFSPRMKLGLVLALFVGALGYFGFTAFQNATVYYMPVAEVIANGPTEDGRLIRVSGKLVDDSFTRDASGYEATFVIADDSGYSMPVSYSGEIGQIFFNPHSVLDLEGRYTDAGVFRTEHMVIRCPSKYLTEQERAELEGHGSDSPYEVVITDGA